MKKIRKYLTPTNFLLGAILVIAITLRIYRINTMLGFWYDQGRDALVIWDLIHSGKLFLIGPMMGFTGIFRGPWYYYLIAPFYYVGGGNPLYPTYFLIATSVVSVYLLYRIGKEIDNQKTGLIAAFIAAISYYVVSASRWLSNPTPTLLVSVLLLGSVLAYLRKKHWAIPATGLLIGLGLNFGAATELFYLPVVLTILIWKRKLISSKWSLLLGFIAFAGAFLPQVIFELRHPGVFASAFNQFVVGDKSFTLSFWEIITTRFNFYLNLLASKFWINGVKQFIPFLIIFIGYLILKWKQFWKKDEFKVVFLFFIAPFIGTLFFRGNQGNIYEYYFTGYYLIFILFVSFILSKLSDTVIGKIIVAIFIIVLSILNLRTYRAYFKDSPEDTLSISFKNQLAAIDWIYSDAEGVNYNVDVYVPPVIPYAYDYLFKWYGNKKCGSNLCGLTTDKQLPLLYTLYEADPDHPERLDAWSKRQAGIGKIGTEVHFGGIYVQRRARILYE